MSEILEAKKQQSVFMSGHSGAYYFESAVTLYHGTSLRRATAMDGIIEPKVGDFFREVYPRAKVLPPTVALELGINRHEMMISQFIENAAVLCIESDRNKFVQATTDHKIQRGVEKFDFVARIPIKIDHIIQGAELQSFFGDMLMNYMISDPEPNWTR